MQSLTLGTNRTKTQDTSGDIGWWMATAAAAAAAGIRSIL